MDESEKRQATGFSLPVSAIAKIRAAAKAAGISASELVTRWAETL